MTRRAGYLGLLTALAAAFSTAMAGGTGPTIHDKAPHPTPGESSAEVEFASPAWYAIVLHRSTKVRMLYARNDVIVDRRHAGRSLAIEQVEPDILVFRDAAGGRRHRLQPGSPIPGFPDLWFTNTVRLTQLHFQYTPVERTTRADPVLITIEGSRAVLKIEVARSVASTNRFPPTPTPRKLDPAVFERVRVKPVGTHAYEVPAADVKPVLENVGEMFAALKPMLLPTFSRQTGINWHLTSAVADGVLNQGGFTVTQLKIARYLGIEVGDTILSINGHPVTSPLNAYWAYQETIVRNPLLSELRVNLTRDGVPITKTYQIR